ncbi:MAG: phage holin family protein [Actinobacteria bacterium]|nr:phage holin family protein [Actinomycetota bacterium]MDQ3210977.1 phage holin family protein [Actinomycetota bacterium]
MRMLIRWAILAVAVFVAAQLVPGIELEEGLVSLLIVAAVLGLVNAVLGTVLRILSIPFLIVTLGLFAIAINMVVLWVTTALTDRIEIDGAWAYFWAALIVSLVTLALRFVVPDGDH